MIFLGGGGAWGGELGLDRCGDKATMKPLTMMRWMDLGGLENESRKQGWKETEWTGVLDIDILPTRRNETEWLGPSHGVFYGSFFCHSLNEFERSGVITVGRKEQKQESRPRDGQINCFTLITLSLATSPLREGHEDGVPYQSLIRAASQR